MGAGGRISRADALIFEVDDVRDVAGDLIRCYDVQVDVQRCVQARSTAGTSKLIGNSRF